jgi:hypothetical protein
MIDASVAGNSHLLPSEGGSIKGFAAAMVPKSINGAYKVIDSDSTSFKIAVDIDDFGSLGSGTARKIIYPKNVLYWTNITSSESANEFRAQSMSMPPSFGWSEASFEGETSKEEARMIFSFTFDERVASSPCDVDQWEAVLGVPAHTPKKEYFLGKCALDVSTDLGRNCTGGIEKNGCMDFRTAMEWVNDQPKKDRNFSSQRVFTLLARLRFRLRIQRQKFGEYIWEHFTRCFSMHQEKKKHKHLRPLEIMMRLLEPPSSCSVVLRVDASRVEALCLPGRRSSIVRTFLKVMLALRLQILNLEQLLHPRSVA